jgi:hypothetical protein
VGTGPFLPHKIPMPSQKGLGLDQESSSSRN